MDFRFNENRFVYHGFDRHFARFRISQFSYLKKGRSFSSFLLFVRGRPLIKRYALEWRGMLM